jgi:putative ABC transport system permease protein
VGKTIEAQHTTGGRMIRMPSVLWAWWNTCAITRSFFEQSPRSPLTFTLRTRVDPQALVPAVRMALHPSAPQRDPRLRPGGIYSCFGRYIRALTLLLVATGIYGVFNYVSRRLPEMGIRMALGAAAGDVLGLVLREELVLAVSGVLLGAGAARVSARWMGTIVYGISPCDPWSYALALLLLPAAALRGCWRPALRAARTNPAQIIREE